MLRTVVNGTKVPVLFSRLEFLSRLHTVVMSLGSMFWKSLVSIKGSEERLHDGCGWLYPDVNVPPWNSPICLFAFENSLIVSLCVLALIGSPFYNHVGLNLSDWDAEALCASLFGLLAGVAIVIIWWLSLAGEAEHDALADGIPELYAAAWGAELGVIVQAVKCLISCVTVHVIKMEVEFLEASTDVGELYCS